MSPSETTAHPASVSRTQAARTLYHAREEVLEEWMNRVRQEVHSAGTLLSPILVNTMPLFIERLAETLCEECIRETVSESSNIAQEHGGERARVTRYGPEQVIQEYLILREVVRTKITSVAPMGQREENIIQKSFDRGIQESMISYFLVHGRIREQFVAALTHDLRNPIGAVKLAADLILEIARGLPKTDEAVQDIQELSARILKSAKRADRMIQGMLDASVVQIGERLSLNITAGDIQQIVLEAVSERSEKEMKRLKTNLISVPGFWDVEAFQRSIENLVNNAFKYGDPNSPVTVTVQETHGRVMVSVHNVGNPIPAENLESLFQVFRRAEAAKAGNIKGWGIGLALARSTAERMGGSLGVDSSHQQGTTFTMDVPCDARPFQGSPES